MFVVVGEALVDLVGQRGSRTLVAHPGGSPANVALGLARLGDPVSLITSLGRDSLGEMVAGHLTASGVRVDAGDRRRHEDEPGGGQPGGRGRRLRLPHRVGHR